MSRLVFLHVLGHGPRDLLVGPGPDGLGVPYDECLGGFSGSSVWDGDDGAVGDVVVGEEVSFQFGGGDLVALYAWISTVMQRHCIEQ